MTAPPDFLKHPLPQPFFAQDTVYVAQALLGHMLVRQFPNQAPWVFRITETEAYTQDEPSCHAYKGNKGRAATLFKAPGLAYVYFIYGMYHCLNVVTAAEGYGAAVLFRALEPVLVPQGWAQKTSGPGLLCKALAITKAAHNEIDMTYPGSELLLCQGESPDPRQVVTTTRIGISQAKDLPWRFYLAKSV